MSSLINSLASLTINVSGIIEVLLFDLGDEGEDLYLLLYNYHIIIPEFDAFAIQLNQIITYVCDRMSSSP